MSAKSQFRPPLRTLFCPRSQYEQILKPVIVQIQRISPYGVTHGQYIAVPKNELCANLSRDIHKKTRIGLAARYEEIREPVVVAIENRDTAADKVFPTPVVDVLDGQATAFEQHPAGKPLRRARKTSSKAADGPHYASRAVKKSLVVCLGKGWACIASRATRQHEKPGKSQLPAPRWC